MKYKSILFIVFFIFLSTSSFSQDSLYQKILSMTQQVNIDMLTNHIKELERAGGHFSRVNFTPGNDSGSAYIYKEFLKIPGLEVELDTFFIPSAQSPYNTKPMVNVIATIKGKMNPDISFVLGGHLDCSASRMGSSTWRNQWKTIKAPGADDNATGVAALIEIARIFAEESNNFSPDYTIKLVAFGAEESGPAYTGAHHGSMHYASNARSKNENILGMCSIDMIGYNNFYNYNDIVSNTNSEWLGRKYVEANEIFSVGLLLNSPPFINGTYSDHDSFWKYDYPAILMIEYGPPWNEGPYYQSNPLYHTSWDSSGSVNMELVKKVTQLNLAAAASFTAGYTLPVELKSFVAEQSTGSVKLLWNTATEKNNFGFEIQRKLSFNNEDFDFITIGFVKGAGTTSETQNYSYLDNIKDLNASSISYRLKQIDFDGTFEYSDEVLIDNIIPFAFALSQNYPNPFNPVTKIKYSIPDYREKEGIRFVTLKVYDIAGTEITTLIKEEKPAGVYEIEFNASGLSSGVYFYRLQVGNFTETKKLTLMK